MAEVHAEPLQTPLINGKYDGKIDTYFVKLNLRRDPKSSTSDLYELKMYLFDNGDPEKFLLFARNFNMTIKA